METTELAESDQFTASAVCESRTSSSAPPLLRHLQAGKDVSELKSTWTPRRLEGRILLVDGPFL